MEHTPDSELLVARKANKVIHKGVTLLPDEAKTDFKCGAKPDVFINTAIDNAIDAADTDEKKAMILAYAVQEANRVVSMLWREQLLPGDLEAEYRELPKMKVLQDKYNEFVSARNERAQKLEEERRAFLEEDKKMDIFKGIINGLNVEEAEKKYDAYQQQMKQAVQQPRG